MKKETQVFEIPENLESAMENCSSEVLEVADLFREFLLSEKQGELILGSEIYRNQTLN